MNGRASTRPNFDPVEACSSLVNLVARHVRFGLKAAPTGTATIADWD
jgi:hypothetical protein